MITTGHKTRKKIIQKREVVALEVLLKRKERVIIKGVEKKEHGMGPRLSAWL